MIKIQKNLKICFLFALIIFTPAIFSDTFHSMLDIGRLQDDLQYPLAQVEESFRNCKKQFPNRLEPVYYLSKALFHKDKFFEAYQLTKEAFNSPEFWKNPDLSDYLWIFEYGLLFQHAINSFHVGAYQEALNISVDLLENNNLPQPPLEKLKKIRDYSVARVLTTIKAPESHYYGYAAGRQGWNLIKEAQELEKTKIGSQMVAKAYAESIRYYANIEAYYYLANYYKKLGMDQNSFEAASHGMELLMHQQLKPILPWIHEYGMAWLYSLAAWKVGKIDEAIEVTEQLLLSSTLNAQQREELVRNLSLYMDNRGPSQEI